MGKLIKEKDIIKSRCQVLQTKIAEKSKILEEIKKNGNKELP